VPRFRVHLNNLLIVNLSMRTPSVIDAARHPELARRVRELHSKALYENLPYTMGFGLVTALGVAWVLWGSSPTPALLMWLAARALIAVTRLGHGVWETRRQRHRGARHHHDYTTYRTLAFIDAIAWGGLGWGLTPVIDLNVAVVSISILLGVAALGVFMLYVDFWTAVLFISPILVPNAFYPLTRGDRLGVFACMAILGFWLILLKEAHRSYRRLMELLRLRVQSEQAVAAKAEALRQAEAHAEAKSRFLATMSHEMRTPMHGILGLVRLIRQREVHPETQRQLSLVEGSGEHLVRVINDVLDFSRLEAGRLPIHNQAFDLDALLHEVVGTSQVLAHDKGLQLSLQRDPQLDARRAPHGRPGFVMGDPVRLRQVLHNLIGNAIKFTADGSVTLHVAAADHPAGQLMLSVSDTGMGIPLAEQAAIFEAFHQAQATHQRRLGGTGLGLTISRELCRAMGGELSLRSQTGAGSTFVISLPLPAVASQQAAASPASPCPTAVPTLRHISLDTAKADAPQTVTATPEGGARAHVLLVEDNLVNAIVAEAELSHLGVEVETLRSGREAVHWLRHHHTDLVLMDGDLPELDGIAATRLVRDHETANRSVRVPIVALSANGSTDFVDRCLAAGMDDHLAKPFRAGDLARVLARHLRQLHSPAAPHSPQAA
jgi:signal transduction histidine kinase/CheY-like chemotaxis protein